MTRPGPNGRCAACRHPERHRLEMHLAGGASTAAVSRRFGLNYYAVKRHWARHVGDERRAVITAGPLKLAELADRAAEGGASLVDHFAALRNVLYDQIVAAAAAGDRNQVASLAGRAVEVLRAMGHLNGVLLRGAVSITNTNIFMGPVFVELEAMLLLELRPYPEARAAVVSGLRRLEARAARPAAGDARVSP